MLASMVNSMAEGLEKVQGNLIQKERMDHELQIAHDLQFMLLPQNVKPASGYFLETHYTPALEVSGDYYDVFALDKDHVGLAVADVSGKGVPGLVIMSMLRTMLRSLAAPQRDPFDVLVAANRMLNESMKRGMFVTCQYGLLNTRKHTFHYASAGHCAPVVFGASKPRCVASQGKPIGLFPERVFLTSLTRHEFTLEPGDGLLLYTDGLVEAMNKDGAQLGYSAVFRCLREWSQASHGSVVDMLCQRVAAHRGKLPPSDDLTMVALQRQPEAARLRAEVAG
jgi:sigma-B regulation protein RsbU (phosphoserine phosphatase)